MPLISISDLYECNIFYDNEANYTLNSWERYFFLYYYFSVCDKRPVTLVMKCSRTKSIFVAVIAVCNSSFPKWKYCLFIEKLFC